MATQDSTTQEQFKTFHGTTPSKAYTSADIGSMTITTGLEIRHIQLRKPFLIGFAEIGSNTVNVIEAAEAIKSKAFLGCINPEHRPVVEFWGGKATRKQEYPGYFIYE